MAVHGNGTELSPIIISDDEGEVPANQPQLNQHSLSHPEHHRSNVQVNTTIPQAPKGMKMMLNMGYTPGRGLGCELDGTHSCYLPESALLRPLGQIEPVPVILKRKRDESGVGCGVSGDSPTH